MTTTAYLIGAAVALYWLHDEDDNRLGKVVNLVGAAVWPISIPILIVTGIVIEFVEAAKRRQRAQLLKAAADRFQESFEAARAARESAAAKAKGDAS